MSDTIQAIVAQLQERVDTARDKASQIVAEAEEKARNLVRDAELEAEKYRRELREELTREREVHRAHLEQTIRDFLLQLREKSIQALLRKATTATLLPALRNHQVVRDAIVQACAEFARREGKTTDLSVLLGGDLYGKLADELKKAAQEVLKDGIEVRLGQGLEGGFRLVFGEKGYVYDFTEEALIETFSDAYGKELRAEIFSWT